MMWQKLGFRGKAATVLLAGLILSIALIWYGVRAVNLVVEAKHVWSDYNRTATATSQQMNRIHKYLGYGGFIHHFKNYVLRADAQYLDRLNADKIEILAAIQKYQTLNISDEERQALLYLRQVVDEYVRNSERARLAFSEGVRPTSVDKLVRVDDTPAVKALAELSRAALVRSEQRELETDQWLTSTVAFLSWGLFIVPLVLLSAAIMVRFLWLSLRANEVAERAQEELEALLQTAPDAMLTINEDGLIVRANQQAENLFGYSIAHLKTMCVEDLIPQTQRLGHVSARQSYFSAPSARKMDGGAALMGLTKDGRLVPLEISLSSLKQGQGVFATATVRDVSERLAAERTVRESEERLLLSQSIANVGTWDWDVETGGLIWSPQIYEIFGVSPDQFEASYENFIKFVHPEDREKVQTGVQKALDFDVLYDVDHRIVLLDGEERFVHERGRVYRNEDGKAVRMVGVVLDITERQAILTALEETKVEADRANQAKSEFLANMSHEIRTPMNAILGMSFLAQKTNLNRQQSDYVNKITSSARSLLRIINDILDFTKIEAGKLDMETVAFSLADVLKNVANVVGGSVGEKKLEILFATDAAVPCALLGDSLRLEQVLINLAGNAVKFTDSGEVVVRVQLENVAPNGDVVLRFLVRDSGIGLSKQDTMKLFAAFSQGDTSTTRRFGGTGLGLSISSRLVEMMGGKMGVESEKGQGSTFSFTAKFGVQAEDIARPSVPEVLKNTPVLVVDDNPSAREILCEIMETFGFKATAVASGEAALAELHRVAASGEPFYKVILMDWLMDGMDGLQATKAVRADTSLPTAPMIIMVTAYGRDMVMQQSENAELDGFLLKPVTPSLLFDTLMNVLRPHETLAGSASVSHPRLVAPKVLFGAHILVVEDNLINQQVAEEILKDAGASVEIANDGGDAYRRICLEKAQFDAVLMDLHMPEMDGYEATKLIRETFAPNDLPILAMTANALREERQKCLDAGMNDYITKPVDVEALYAMLLKWIAPRRLKAPPVEPKRTAVLDINVEGMVLPDTLDGFDLSDGLDRMLGRPDLYLKFLLKLVDGHANDAQLVRTALAQDDRKTAHRLAHSVKGVSGNLSAVDLYAAAAGLSDAIESGEQNLEPPLSAFEAQLERAIASVRTLTA
ncbi:hybrid sensor histidine kinase/response regulator [Magnetovibrio blakemorei]|uniref:Sensory/regulatory protein RpfC n=1 Tax=Magnetovibrio blakemorei TaxID=28181 RepID=A0A1E5Q830_9PROT|nr:response regulator [Magnetovibrio blakemorei]OEJ67495.1 hypothetical protein BEN30_08610 [Magnetovibrio blakemorei]